MKPFAARGYLIANSRTEVKLVYAGFLVFAAIGVATMVALVVGRIGFSWEGVVTHYRGGDFGGEMRFARSFGEMMEVTHFHAFIMGPVYLTLAHLFIATSVSTTVRWTVIVGTFVALLGDLGGMWLVRYVSEWFAPWMLVCWAGEWLGMGAMIVIPLVEISRPLPDEDPDEDDD